MKLEDYPIDFQIDYLERQMNNIINQKYISYTGFKTYSHLKNEINRLKNTGV